MQFLKTISQCIYFYFSIFLDDCLVFSYCSIRPFQACKNFQILSEKRSVSQSKSGCCSYDNHSVIVFSLTISQSKICFYSIDRSNLLFCFSLPLTFLSTELSLFLRKVCLQYFFLRRMLKYFATLNRVLEILLFRAVITFN